MPRPDPKRPRRGQLGLFEAEATRAPDTVLRGRHSDAMDRALAEARAQDALAPVDEGLETVLRAGAWALDSFEAQNKPYGPSKIIDPIVAALREAHLTPDSRAVAADAEVAQLLQELANHDESPQSTISHPADAGLGDTGA